MTSRKAGSGFEGLGCGALGLTSYRIETKPHQIATSITFKNSGFCDFVGGASGETFSNVA